MTVPAGAVVLNVSVTAASGTGFTKIGQGQGVTTTLATDIFYGSDPIGDKDYEYWTSYGAVLSAPKTTLPNSEVVLKVPSEQNKYTVIIGKETTVKEQIAAGMTGPLSKVSIDSISVEGAKTAVKAPITAPVAVLDTEVSDDTGSNLVLVGGPSVNSLVKKLGGMYADANTYKDVGKLFWVDGAFGGAKTAVVAAGWDADNTRAASYVLAHYDSNAGSLAGKVEVTITGKDVNSLSLS